MCKCFLSCVLVIFLHLSTLSQSCTGSLGEPIVNITFGAGPNPGAQLNVSVPGASTSYSYVSPTGNPPANIIYDGDYSLVNATPPNPGWLQGPDHTGNTNGYMAFFNAAPTPGEFYRQTVTGLCPGTTYEFAAWILNAINSNAIPGAVKPNVTFRVFNPANLVTPLTVFNTGDVPVNNVIIWHRYATLFTTPAGLGSVVITLSNNNIGGTTQVGNDLAIDDITFRACGPLTTASFSSGSAVSTKTQCGNGGFTLFGTVGPGLIAPAYQWQISVNNGLNWNNITGATSVNYTVPGTTPGNYLYRLVSQEVTNLASVYCKFYSNILDLTVKPISYSTLNQSICEGQSFQGHTTTGTFVSMFIAANGCDSVYTLNLTVKPKSFTTVSVSVCEGQTYGGHSTAGTFVDTYVAANGCDSIRTLNLIIKPRTFLTLTNTICEGQSVAGHTTTGIYTDTYIGANGCDSIRTLNLIVKPKSFSNTNQFICEGQTFEGHGSTGVYVTTLTAANGCDSVHTLNLTVKPHSFSVINQAICDGNQFEGHFVSGTYLTTFTAANGCDSIHTLNLIVKPKSYFTLVRSICEGQSFEGYTMGGTYTNTFVAANGCDSIRTLVLTVKQKSFVTSTYSICEGESYEGHGVAGTYVSTFTGSNGCDSVHTLVLTVKPLPFVNALEDTSICGGQTITLNTSGNANSYSWSPTVQLNNPNIQSPQFSGLPGHKYVVTATLNGCVKSDSLIVSVRAPSLFAHPPDKSVCINSTVQLEGYNGAGVSYFWSGQNLDNTSAQNPLASPISSTVYSVKITDNICLFDTTFLLSVNVLPLPTIRAKSSNDVNCAEVSTVLTASGGITYSWFPLSGLNNGVSANPVATPVSTTTYYVTGYGTNGCMNKDSVTVKKTAAAGKIFIPNSFSPNNDGKNDCFKVIAPGDMTEFTFSIFNRWGEKVFETKKTTECWNGKFRNLTVPPGALIYVVKAVGPCGTFTEQGTVLLIR